jgi:hypothetical protein
MTISTALAKLGNERVLHCQQILLPTSIPAAVVLSLGYRETGMTNEEGGAVWDAAVGKWVASKTDTGFCQISRKYQLPALAKMPGCVAGTWEPVEGHTAAETGYCPRFADSVNFIAKEFAAAISFCVSQKVAMDHITFAVAAHNAGVQGAWEGYKAGNVDEHTAQGNYSSTVMANAVPIHEWILAHPNWQYKDL